jgi:hypothetical protein
VTVAVDMLSTIQEVLLADRNFWNPKTFVDVIKALLVLALYKSSKRGTQPLPEPFKHKWYCIEILIGQFVKRFPSKKIWEKDAWHLISRW